MNEVFQTLFALKYGMARIRKAAVLARSTLFILPIIFTLLIPACWKRGDGGAILRGPLDTDPNVSDIVMGADVLSEGGSTTVSVVAADLDATGAPYPVTYIWEASVGSFIGSTGSSTTYNAPADVEEDTVVTLTVAVTGSGNATVIKEATLTVGDRPNRPPTAQPYYYEDVTSGTVVFVANATDPDDDPITHNWTVSPDATVMNPADSETEIRFFEPGVYTISLTVADDKGASNRYELTYVVAAYFPNIIWMSAEMGKDQQGAPDPDLVVVSIWVWQVTDCFEVDCPIIFDDTKLDWVPPPPPPGEWIIWLDALWGELMPPLMEFLPPNIINIAVAGDLPASGSGKIVEAKFKRQQGASGDVVFAFDTSPSPQGVAKTRYVDANQNFIEFTGGTFGVTYTLP